MLTVRSQASSGHAEGPSFPQREISSIPSDELLSFEGGADITKVRQSIFSPTKFYFFYSAYYFFFPC
jgi:hypothetical protein